MSNNRQNLMLRNKKIEIDKFINCIIEHGLIKNFIITNMYNDIQNLRKFHNYIKSQLIIYASERTKAKKLLDIACGRGGDLLKWVNLKYKLEYILAFDSHSESIFSSIKKGDSFDGAISRFVNLKNIKYKIPKIIFKKINILDQDILKSLNKIDNNTLYDIVSCQFALHYFCENDTTLNNVLNIVSSKLKKNGFFIGTATDGDIIKKILDNGSVQIPLLTIFKKQMNNYLFYINTENDKNINQNYFEVQGISSEFYLFKQNLKEIAKKNNLELIEFKSFYDWYQEYKKQQHKKEMTIYEMVISFLNFSFIFKKI